MKTKQSNPSRNYINSRPAAFGDLSQIKKAREHSALFLGLVPVARPVLKNSNLTFFFECVNNRCRTKFQYNYRTRFYSNIMHSSLACKDCGHLYIFKKDERGNPGLFYRGIVA